MIDVGTSSLHYLDYREFLSLVPEKSVDLAVIDPPYNLKKAKWDTFKSQDEFLGFTFDWIDRLIPKLKDTASLYVFNTPFNSAYILDHLVKIHMIFQNWIVWDKRDGFNNATRKYSGWQETILFFTKSMDYTFNADEIRIPYESKDRIAHAVKMGILKNGKRWFPNEKGKLCGDVWKFSSERHKTKIKGKTQKLLHVTPKPLDMVERMILASSNENDLVLDCFVGSGTTAIAAIKHNRRFLGCDSNKTYVDYAKKRIADELIYQDN